MIGKFYGVGNVRTDLIETLDMKLKIRLYAWSWSP